MNGYIVPTFKPLNGVLQEDQGNPPQAVSHPHPSSKSLLCIWANTVNSNDYDVSGVWLIFQTRFAVDEPKPDYKTLVEVCAAAGSFWGLYDTDQALQLDRNS